MLLSVGYIWNMHDNNFLPKEINILTLVMTMLAVFSKAFQLWNIKIAAKIKKNKQKKI